MPVAREVAPLLSSSPEPVKAKPANLPGRNRSEESPAFFVSSVTGGGSPLSSRFDASYPSAVPKRLFVEVFPQGQLPSPKKYLPNVPLPISAEKTRRNERQKELAAAKQTPASPNSTENRARSLQESLRVLKSKQEEELAKISGKGDSQANPKPKPSRDRHIPVAGSPDQSPQSNQVISFTGEKVVLGSPKPTPQPDPREGRKTEKKQVSEYKDSGLKKPQNGSHVEELELEALDLFPAQAPAGRPEELPATRRPWADPPGNCFERSPQNRAASIYEIHEHIAREGSRDKLTRLHIHSNTSKSLLIKDLGGSADGEFSKGDSSDFKALFGSPNQELPFRQLGLGSSQDASRSDSGASPGGDAGRARDELGVVRPFDRGFADSKEKVSLPEELQQLSKSELAARQSSCEPEQLFSTAEEKSEIITSFILENLIIESISEDFCLPKFIAVLGPYGRHLEQQELRRYIEVLFELISGSPAEAADVERRLNLPIGHSDIQKLMLASPLIPEAEQESIGTFEYEPVLDIRLYISLEERFREQEYVARGFDNFEMEREHITHKMVFDSLNENLDYRRKGGISGLPPKFSRRFREPSDFGPPECRALLDGAKQEVLAWARMKNGTLMEREPQLSYYNDLESLEQAREKAMVCLLQEYVSRVDPGPADRLQVEGAGGRAAGSLPDSERLRVRVLGGGHGRRPAGPGAGQAAGRPGLQRGGRADRVALKHFLITPNRSAATSWPAGLWFRTRA